MSSDVNYSDSVRRLADKAVRYSTVIDIGCADGQFFLENMQWLPGAVPLNIDANRIYEPSLTAIKDAVGGDYRICAITDHSGEIEITESVHPYWSSVRPAGDLYWTRINELAKTLVTVKATTLDALITELGLKPPFLLKLDVQGAECAALTGAGDVLSNTHAVICEADIDDFQGINRLLAAAGFDLYDITTVARVQDGSLGWFYPVYVNKKLEHVWPRAFWDSQQNDAVIDAQVTRRAEILKSNADILNRLRYGNHNVSRNDPCPCGSGRKFRQCCGSYKT